MSAAQCHYCHGIKNDGGSKLASLLADMGKDREHKDIVWKIFESCGNFDC